MEMNPRELAIKALAAVGAGGEKPRDALADLAPRDRAFEMELLYGSLRHLDTLDWVGRRFLKKPGGLNPETINNIRIGLYQLLYMRVPQFAAVNEAVSIERRQKPLVNAVLRGAARELDSIRAELDAMREGLATERDTLKAAATIALLTSHPKWLTRRWVARFGIADALALAEADNTRPPLTLRVNTLRSTREEFIAKLSGMGIEAAPTVYSPVGVTLTGEISIEALRALMGSALVQDEAAQLVSIMLRPEEGMRILDACAAPGGKATHIAELIKDRGEVVALDIDEARMGKLHENASALGLRSITPVTADIMDYATSEGPEAFDAILLDAPCTALGVMRRNPDVRYRHEEAALAAYGKRQLDMLRTVSGLLRPGGRLVYATCSTEPEEGEDVIEAALKSAAEFFMIDEALAGGIARGGVMRTYPHTHGMDGFFAAAIGKRKD